VTLRLLSLIFCRVVSAETDAAALRAATAALHSTCDVAGSLRRRHDEVQEQLLGTARRIDRLATLEAVRRERRMAYPDPPGEPDPAEPAAAGQPPPADRWPEDGPPAPGVAVPEPAAAGGPDEVRSEREFAPRLGWPLKAAILLALVLVELPIQYVIFSYFHGSSQDQVVFTSVFTVAVALIMVLAPHLSGYLYRRRHATGTERLLGAVSLAMLVPCGYVAALLGFLRAKVLLAGTKVVGSSPDDGGGAVPTKLDSFHLNSVTIVVMFVALLVLTGAISFLLGAAQDHPFLYAYRGALAERTRLSGELDAAAPTVRAAEERAGELADVRPLHADQWRQQAEVVPELYRAAALVYLDALSQAMNEPAATEAIARLSGRLAEADLPLAAAR
jgi:hypothetical protein